MKKSNFLISLICLFMLSGCSSNEIEAPGDGYVDSLPTNIEDGVIFHAFNWTYNEISENLNSIYDAGFRSIQTSPVQQPKSGGTKWEFFYQPVSFAIATNSPLGTKEELMELCSLAKEKGMSIIVDIVFNHMATPGSSDSSIAPPIDKEVELYEPYIYNHQDECFHRVTSSYGSGEITQLYSGLPDLNTANEHVQERALSLLKECIDVGVDGFRFDAAKHIETPQDPQFPSSFWDNTLEKAKEYYREKNDNKELYAYGEILNEVGGGRDISYYTKYMKVTDNSYISSINTYFNTKKVSYALNGQYGKNSDAKNLLTWVESHDTYTDSSSHIGDKKTIREWSLIASRKDTTSLYFARCDENATVGKVSSYVFEDVHIAYANYFHNRFVHCDEYISGINEYIYLNERISDSFSGAYIVNPTSTAETVEIKFSHLEDGYYFDQVNARQVHIKNGKAKIEFDNCGIVFLTPSKNRLRASWSPSLRSLGYVTPFDLKIDFSSTKSCSYKIDNGDEINIENETATIRIGEGLNGGDVTKITIKFSNGAVESTRYLTFTKIDLIDGGFNVLNFNKDYINNYEIYIWTWISTSSSKWTKDYDYIEDSSVLLIHNYENLTGFLVALFEKGYEIQDMNKWDENCVKQTADIHPNDIYYDAINF